MKVGKDAEEGDEAVFSKIIRYLILSVIIRLSKKHTEIVSHFTVQKSMSFTSEG